MADTADRDPLEGSSYDLAVTVKSEIKEEEDTDEDGYNTMALLELAQCVQTNQEPIEFNTTDAMMNPKTGLMVCMHCLEDVDANLLSDHMVNAHNYRRILFKCQICCNIFQERQLLVVHRKECRPPQKRHKRKSFQQILREVETSEDTGNDFENVTCPICVLELPKYCLKDHLIAEHSNPDMILTCGKCNRNFKSKLTLREHIKLVHESIEDSVECELCGQKFRSPKYLSNHKRNVHPSGDKIHKCTVCGKEFKSRLCVHQHTKYVHPPQSASVACPHCPHKVFKSRINLQQHLKVSHGWRKGD
ncbi:zinc finger protein 680-like [Galleria mellonella]|uniref:Zinc finger protein 680-like n=1 Tax=Galleria mellonella TaxID=7137 RepID=A0ABM3MAA6_GALME|nr:zinc finger protein 680-like [Galleria mellonella]